MAKEEMIIPVLTKIWQVVVIVLTSDVVTNVTRESW
jgi:hypothetical protein